MNSGISLPVKHVSETAWLVAACRAMETERPNGLFRDPLAAKLTGKKGEELLRAMPRIDAGVVMLAVRTRIIDELILNLVGKGVDTIINLAAGLDTRPYRLSLPPDLKWVEVDLSDIIVYKSDLLSNETPNCNLEGIVVDLTNQEERQSLFRRVDATAASTLVITEGLLGYLSPKVVASLATDLFSQKSFEWWIMDIIEPGLLELALKYWGDELGQGNVRLHFAPEEGADFFLKYGWKLLEFRSFGAEGSRLGYEFPEPFRSSNDSSKPLHSSGIGVLKALFDFKKQN